MFREKKEGKKKRSLRNVLQNVAGERKKKKKKKRKQIIRDKNEKR